MAWGGVWYLGEDATASDVVPVPGGGEGGGWGGVGFWGGEATAQGGGRARGGGGVCVGGWVIGSRLGGWWGAGERKGQLRTSKTAPPPTRALVFTPRHLGLEPKRAEQYQRARKESLGKGGRVMEKMSH